jgi:hypothetical protein
VVKMYQVARQRMNFRILNKGKRPKCSIHDVYLIFYDTLCVELIKFLFFLHRVICDHIHYHNLHF